MTAETLEERCAADAELRRDEEGRVEIDQRGF